MAAAGAVCLCPGGDRARSHTSRSVISPSPFYQIYEGAALLAVPSRISSTPRRPTVSSRTGMACRTDIWQRTQLVYVCPSSNPTGAVMPLAGWQRMFELADRYGFVIARTNVIRRFISTSRRWVRCRPRQLGRSDYIAIWWCSAACRNAPTCRACVRLCCRRCQVLENSCCITYHGCAMNPMVQAASVAWNDEAHVEDNRQQYRAKFARRYPAAEAGAGRRSAGRSVLPVGPGRRSATANSPAGCIASGMSPFAGSFLAREAWRQSGAGTTCASHWWRRWMNVSKRRNRRIVEFCKTCRANTQASQVGLQPDAGGPARPRRTEVDLQKNQ